LPLPWIRCCRVNLAGGIGTDREPALPRACTRELAPLGKKFRVRV
jgi:hypothetical protein